METVIHWLKTIFWAIVLLIAFIVVTPILMVAVGIYSRNDDMHIPDPETDEAILKYLNEQGHGGYDKM